jgi:N-acetyl-gamma-glutamyl-phosphate reductase
MSLNKINVLIAGATGYVGLDLVYLLSKHPKIKILKLCAQKSIGKEINKFDKRIKKKFPLITDLNKTNWNEIDLVFLSLPNGQAQMLVKKLYYKFPNIKFIDLSADFRLENSNEYKKWYKIHHKAKKLISKSIYSVTELVKNKIRLYRIIGNPGCYPTSIQLALNPLFINKNIKLKNIIIDSKSGYSGAGKGFEKKFKHKNLYKSTYAYSTTKHRHMSELDQEFKKITNQKIEYTFNPYLIPTFRGILSSIYVEVKKGQSARSILSKLKQFHKKNKFIKILKLNSNLGTGNVINTNNCEISVCETRVKGRIIIFSAIDNLIKGAAGQAIQNMNILFNNDQATGLK